MSFENAQGISFTFDGKKYTATQIAVTRERAEFDVSTTDLGSGSLRRFRKGKIKDTSIKVDWIGATFPPTKVTAAFSIAGTDIGATDGAGKPAICTGLSITGNAGDLIRGTATFKISND